MYSVEFTKRSKAQLDKLHEQLRIRIISTLDRIRILPFNHVKRKQGTPYFILRIGQYRAILDIKNNELIIMVIEIGPRGKIYK
ncbi:MAG: type II toxin-antitoxin system RelE/ParE family toxin [archaeon]